MDTTHEKIAIETNKFNDLTKLLVNDLGSRFPDDLIIRRAKGRVLAVSDATPVYIIENVGKYLFGYRDQIYAGNYQFFILNDYDSDIKAKVGQEKADIIRYIMPRAKDAFLTMSDEDKIEYLKIIQQMLDSFIEYVHAVRSPA
jgi:hypothetical protein